MRLVGVLGGCVELDHLNIRGALARAVELAPPRITQASAERVCRIDVDDEEVLFEPRRPRDHRAGIVEHDRVTVEHELVLAADEVAEGEVRACVARTRDEHLFAFLGLPDMERRRREIDDELCSRESEVGRGWPGLPDVLADRDSDGGLAETEDDEVASLGEVPVLVENAVVRKEVLAIDGLHAATRADSTGVREIAVEPRRPDECHDAVGRSGDLLQGRASGAYESRPEEEILGRVARRGELGIGDELRPRCAGVAERRKDLRAIAVEVADDRIQLCERDSQGFRLTVTNRV